jgi:hypothetical protein
MQVANVIKFNTLVSEFTSMENNIYYLVPQKRKQNDIKWKGAIHTFLTVSTYSGNYNVQQDLTYFLFQRWNISLYTHAQCPKISKDLLLNLQNILIDDQCY